jgi:hypothetical protein
MMKQAEKVTADRKIEVLCIGVFTNCFCKVKKRKYNKAVLYVNENTGAHKTVASIDR